MLKKLSILLSIILIIFLSILFFYILNNTPNSNYTPPSFEDGSLAILNKYNATSEKIILGKYYDTNVDLNIIYKNNSLKNKPVIIYIHGGDPRSGNSNVVLDSPVLSYLNKDYVVVGVSWNAFIYNATYPYQIQDIKNAYFYIVNNSNKYGIDKNKIVILGHSAGAYLSLMLGNEKDLNISSIIAFSPVTNYNIFINISSKQLDGISKSEFETYKNGITTYVGCDVFNSLINCQKRVDELSPIKIYNKFYPPVLLIHGKLDSIVPYLESVNFYNQGKNLNNLVEIVLNENSQHDLESNLYYSFNKTLIFMNKNFKN